MNIPSHAKDLATLAIVGHVLLNGSAWVLPAVSEYRLLGDHISELVLGRYGVVQTAAFVISGLGTMGLAAALGSLVRRSGSGAAGVILVGLYGVGAVIAAMAPTDRIDRPADLGALTTSGTLHVATALVSFVCVIVGMFVLTWVFRRLPAWRTLTPWSAIFAGGALSLAFAQSEGPLVGLLQRLLVAVVSGWLILVALRVRAIAQSVVHA